MLLSRLVRFQLVTFAILSVIGLTVMATVYMRVQTFVGATTITAYVDLPATGGLYRFGNVTFRGVEVGKVTAVDLTADGVRATLSIDDSRKIPADLAAEVRSVSAIGEQYLDLRPRTDSAPYLKDGAVIARSDTTIPEPVGLMLDELSSLVGTIPADKLHDLLDELFKGVNGTGVDLASLMSSAEKLSGELEKVGDPARVLLEDAGPLLDSQAQSLDAIKVWTRSLAGVTGQVVSDDPQIRTLLRTGPGALDETARLLDSVKLTLPVLLANLTSVGQLGVTYHAGLEQLLVLLPPSISMIQAVQPKSNASGLGLGDFRISGLSDPPACTVGFLPPTQWRSPQDTTTIDTPDNLYCKLPQDSPIAVRGARNIPCATNPDKRAATAELCNSNEDFAPLATEQPLLGPYPRDPGLESQGVPPDVRPIPDTGQQPPTVTPSAYGATPPVGAARYDPRTGNYVGPDGRFYQQSDLVAVGGRPWTDMLMH